MRRKNVELNLNIVRYCEKLEKSINKKSKFIELFKNITQITRES